MSILISLRVSVVWLYMHAVINVNNVDMYLIGYGGYDCIYWYI